MCGCAGNSNNISNVNTSIVNDCGCSSKVSPCNLEAAQNLGIDSGITVIIQRNLENLLEVYGKAWVEQRTKGKSFKTVWVSKFYAALALAVIIKYNSRCYSFDVLKEQYNINQIIDCLACDNINFKDMLKQLGLPANPLIGGIENMNIECLFEVEPEIKVLPDKKECNGDIVIYPKKSFLNHLKSSCTYAC